MEQDFKRKKKKNLENYFKQIKLVINLYRFVRILQMDKIFFSSKKLIKNSIGVARKNTIKCYWKEILFIDSQNWIYKKFHIFNIFYILVYYILIYNIAYYVL